MVTPSDLSDWEGDHKLSKSKRLDLSLDLHTIFVAIMVFIRPDTWRLFCSFRDTAHDLVSHKSHIWSLKECSSNNIITYGLRHECKLINEDENFLRRCQRKLNRVNLELQIDLIQFRTKRYSKKTTIGRKENSLRGWVI